MITRQSWLPAHVLVDAGQEPALLSGSLARDALKLCYLEAKSAATGKAVEVK